MAAKEPCVNAEGASMSAKAPAGRARSSKDSSGPRPEPSDPIHQPSDPIHSPQIIAAKVPGEEGASVSVQALPAPEAGSKDDVDTL